MILHKTDTIGIEATNEERTVEKIEEMIKQHFDENTKNIENNIHGTIYFIKSDSTRLGQKKRFNKKINEYLS